jgi:hypothetical protein
VVKRLLHATEEAFGLPPLPEREGAVKVLAALVREVREEPCGGGSDGRVGDAYDDGGGLFAPAV